jgi:putative copper export protein
VDSEASHAVGTRPIWLGVGLNALHIAAMGVWVGGLIAFLVVMRQPKSAGMRAALLRRFGRLAGGSFVLLILTGVAMAAQHLAALSDLITTTYGRVLGVKLVVVLDVALVALGGAIVNRVVERRRQDDGHARRWWGTELLLLACVLVLAGLLGSLVPPT